MRQHKGQHRRYPNTGKLETWPLQAKPGEAEWQLLTSIICSNSETQV